MRLPDKAVIAEYTPTDVNSYKGNPFIEALPPRFSRKQVINYLKSHTQEEYDANDDDITRCHKIFSIIDGFFQPTSQHSQLELKISIMLRKGYVSRNINNGELHQRLNENYASLKNGGEIQAFSEIESTADGTILIGPSGGGKTKTLNKILAAYPQVIFHPLNNQIQLTYIKVDCPHDGTLKGLTSHFFAELDKALGTHYQNMIDTRLTVSHLVKEMKQKALKYSIGVLVIDEIQSLLTARSGGKDMFLSFIGNLINVINIPVLMIGTPRAKLVLEENFMYARRGTGLGAISWSPIKTAIQRQNTSNSKNKSEWELFTDQLWKKQFIHNAIPQLDEDIRNTWYDCSQGIADVTVKLFVFSQLRAIVTGKEQISAQLMRKVYEDEFEPIHPMIDALRSQDPDRIAKYSDLCLPNTLDQLAERNKLISDLATKKAKSKVQFSGHKMARECYEMLLGLGIEKREAKGRVDTLISDNIDAELKDWVKFALQLKTSSRKRTPSKSKSLRNTPPQEWEKLAIDDMRFIFSQHGDKTYDALVNMQIIIPEEELY